MNKNTGGYHAAKRLSQVSKDGWIPLEDAELARRYRADESVDSISVFLAVRQLVLLPGQTRWVYVAESYRLIHPAKETRYG